ncbi:RNA polymerase factor sigma-54 [Ruminococcaceae bacterium OttesenSCG-928-O06]|nr:RNA polymerase factor sigma-54 [Ruminococcaceae bacterium OttesenSCG-928-O06]
MAMDHSQKLHLTQNLQQKLILTTAMYQSLEILRMPVQQLADYIEEQLHENPMLELDGDAAADGAELFAPVPLPEDAADEVDDAVWEEYEADVSQWSRGDYASPGMAEYDPGRLYAQNRGEDFKAMLLEQLDALPLEPPFHSLCRYIIECLNQRGYFSFEAGDIAQELGLPLYDVMQALYAVQSLQPTGVAARTLQECLILQLAESPNFNHYTVRIVKEGLPLLADNDIDGIAQLLGCSAAVARQSADAVRALNPIPSRGYYTGEQSQYIVPDAAVVKDGEGLLVVLNSRALPGLELNREYCKLMEGQVDADTGRYLKTRYSDAVALLKAVEDRNTTLHKVIQCIAELQQAFFEDGTSLAPMTLSDVAGPLGIHPSTVSRAVQEKYITCAAGTVGLKSLFTTGVKSASGQAVSNVLIRQKIEKYIEAEDKARPLSDEDLRGVLQTLGIDISRRTVAKYREELGIENSARRRRANH